ncbi:hypothetical protein LJR178_001782 [Variovorax sp. LjRoot178]
MSMLPGLMLGLVNTKPAPCASDTHIANTAAREVERNVECIIIFPFLEQSSFMRPGSLEV